MLRPHVRRRRLRVAPAAIVLLAAATAVSLAAAQDRDPEADRAAVVAAVTQYVDGFYKADHSLLHAVCHPQLSKHGVADRYRGRPFEHLDEITYEQLAWLGDNYNADGRFDPATARRDIRVFELRGDYACAELIAGDWLDFFHLARLDGQWKIVNVAWWGDVPGEGSDGDDADRAAITQAVSDYVQGYYHGDGDRCVSGVHDQLDKRIIQHTETGDILREMSREQLRHVAAVGNVGERRHIDPATGRADIVVHQVWGNVASARLDAEDWFDFFHLVRIDGRWTIVNVLWGLHA